MSKPTPYSPMKTMKVLRRYPLAEWTSSIRVCDYWFRTDLLRITHKDYMDAILEKLLFMRKTQEEGNYILYEMGEGGNGASVIVEVVSGMREAVQGYGSVHHVAFRVKDKEVLEDWINYVSKIGAPNSGFVDRFWFQSLYARLYPSILFEFATDGPGFIDDDEDYETLGEKLSLPPRFRDRREYVESVIRPIDTVRSTKEFKKEYFD